MAKQNISVTTDCVIFYSKRNTHKVLLIQRKSDPFQGQWALPGGFLEDDEPLEVGAKRELQEETGLKVEKLKQLKAFGTPGRDPRGRTISIVFYGHISSEEKVEGSDDAADARWFNLDELPQLAFDHSEILEVAREIYFRSTQNSVN